MPIYPISEQEIKAVRWIEKIGTPILIAGILSLTTCMYGTTQAVESLKLESVNDKEFHAVTGKTIKLVEKSQIDMALQVNTVQVDLQHVIEDVKELKAQSFEILRILRER